MLEAYGHGLDKIARRVIEILKNEKSLSVADMKDTGPYLPLTLNEYASVSLGLQRLEFSGVDDNNGTMTCNTTSCR